MGRFLTSVMRGIRAFSTTPDGKRFILEGKPITCPHCGHGFFIKGSALLNTAGRTFFNLDWTDKSATTLACAECGRVEWFLQEPDEVP